jgi:hypothetical protein
VKVLYISGAIGADYQCDLVFHGLRSLLGPDCVDVQKLWFMYTTSEHYMFHTLYKKLPDIEVDRDDIEAKIRSKHFEAVVYGSVHRNRDHLDLVGALYPRNKIAFIDGEDGPEINGTLGRGWYFKRELYDHHSDILPIQFGVPRECVRPIDTSRKSRLMAHCDPRDRSTMVYYDSEQRYYDQYSDAWFGYTMKKAGWDCMRHHEILAAGCMPYFDNFHACPPLTLERFDRGLFADARRLQGCWGDSAEEVDEQSWFDLIGRVRGTALMTTEDLAKLVLDRVCS